MPVMKELEAPLNKVILWVKNVDTDSGVVNLIY